MHRRGLRPQGNLLPLHRPYGNVPILLCWGTNQERAMRILLEYQRKMSKYISAAFFRDVVNRQRFGGEDEGISFDYMLELIEQEIIKNYKECKTNL